MMDERLDCLYAAVKDAVVAHHPHDKHLVGVIAELFLKFDKEVVILERTVAVIEDVNPTEFLATIVCTKKGCDFNCRDPAKMLAHIETHRAREEGS